MSTVGDQIPSLEIAVRIEKIIATVLDEAHKKQVDEVMDVFSEGPEGLYRRPPY